MSNLFEQAIDQMEIERENRRKLELEEQKLLDAKSQIALKAKENEQTLKKRNSAGGPGKFSPFANIIYEFPAAPFC